MTAFTVTVQDQGVQATLQLLRERLQNMRPVLLTLGEQIVERTKQRFATSTGPDGQAWAPNSIATLAMVSGSLGKGYRKKNGDLNAKGQKTLAGKKPLIGQSKDLSRQIVYAATGNTLTVSSTPVYAAMQQFGGVTSARSMIPGKTIPARPFLPVRQDGTLYPQEQQLVLQTLNDFLMDGL